MKVLTLDWRKFGDFSAVGQLTQKIFSHGSGYSIHPVQCINNTDCRVFEVGSDKAVVDVYKSNIHHDAVLNYVSELKPSVFYVRLSPHIPTLELACKLISRFHEVPLIVHYMDKPSFSEMSNTRIAYVQHMYDVLVKNADQFLTIHSSSIEDLEKCFGYKPKVLANFIRKPVSKTSANVGFSGQPIKIFYFGSIDKKMNESAIASLAQEVSSNQWVSLSLWSNSGLWGEIKQLVENSQNIHAFKSNLDVEQFQRKMSEADILLLPYNFDETSKIFLKHSFSNKFVDYLEAGGVILCLGPAEIPTVMACKESGLALVLESKSALKAAFSSEEAFRNALGTLDLESYNAKAESLRRAQEVLVEEFFDSMERIVSRGSKRTFRTKDITSKSHIEETMLGVLIRQKFFDHAQPVEQQSLVSSLMAEILRRRGYKGLQYEI
ncbi:hypothetical protein [Sulfitobacter faviae]|uniref:hypothetical protein n=1 Tax=Sulfitobacter faviae TaxID=1775881 RepID=UPI00245681F8|nr:hypothetical protein [Sulfitobacter faviae]